MSINWQNDIENFHKLCGHYIASKPEVPPREVRQLRHNLVKEEMRETLDAIMEGNLVGVADGIADSIVVLLGTAVSHGIYMQPIWDEVHRSNMAKVGGEKREDGKQLKPKGWSPPDVEGLLQKQKA